MNEMSVCIAEQARQILHWSTMLINSIDLLLRRKLLLHGDGKEPTTPFEGLEIFGFSCKSRVLHNIPVNTLRKTTGEISFDRCTQDELDDSFN